MPTTTATMTRQQDPSLVELIDALVESIDPARTESIDRLREALEPFGAVGLFNDELRLNGVPSTVEDQFCEGWL